MKMEGGTLVIMLLSMVLVGWISLAVKLVKWSWVRPKKLEKLLREQGLKGNPYRLLIGDMKDLVSVVNQEKPRSIHFSDHLPPHILPYFHQTTTKYGENSFVWFGPTPRLMIGDPQLIKEILSQHQIFQKPHPDPIGDNIIGGLLWLDGDKWAIHRKIINPAFHMLKLKNMFSAMHLSCSILVHKWESLIISGTEEIDVWPYLNNLSGDVISRTVFGSSYEQGQRIFELQNMQIKLLLEILHFMFIPGWSLLPTKSNKRFRAFGKEIDSLVRGVINDREKALGRGEAVGDDLLATLMESNLKEINDGKANELKTIAGMSTEDMVKECRLFYLAGSETTSLLMLWTMVMLSKHQEWQDRARHEVLQVFGNKEPTFEGLNCLKIVNMILHEVMRLYPSIPVIARSPTKTVKLGNITLPIGVELLLLIAMVHNDPKIWGDDVNEFKPERFNDGISGATGGQLSFIPFSSGARKCIGQQFALIQAKLALSVILQRFSFHLSSSYVHAPFPLLSTQPQYGAPLIFHKLPYHHQTCTPST